MKAVKRIIGRLAVGGVLALGLASSVQAQTNALTFTATKATNERAIQLRWQSKTNGVYRLEYAQELSRRYCLGHAC